MRSCVARSGRVELRFGRAAIDLGRLQPGQGVWKTDDPELSTRLRRSFEGSPARLVDLDLEVHAEAGLPLEVAAITANGHRASVRTESPLAPARSQPADLNLLRDQLGRLGGTIYRLRDLAATINGAPMVPKSLLNQVRRDLVDQLDLTAAAPPPRAIAAEPSLARPADADPPGTTATSESKLSVPRPPILCHCRSSAAARTRSRRPWRWGCRRSTPITRTSRSTPRPSPRSGAGRGDLSGHAPDREACRGEPVPLPGEAGGRRHSCPQRGRVVLLR